MGPGCHVALHALGTLRIGTLWTRYLKLRNSRGNITSSSFQPCNLKLAPNRDQVAGSSRYNGAKPIESGSVRPSQAPWLSWFQSRILGFYSDLSTRLLHFLEDPGSQAPRLPCLRTNVLKSYSGPTRDRGDDPVVACTCLMFSTLVTQQGATKFCRSQSVGTCSRSNIDVIGSRRIRNNT